MEDSKNWRKAKEMKKQKKSITKKKALDLLLTAKFAHEKRVRVTPLP